MPTIQSDILKGYHPVTIMRRHELTVAELQHEVVRLSLCYVAMRGRGMPRRLPAVREGHWLTWQSRFRKLRHFGV